MDKEKRWHEIGDRLTKYLGICPCQRKIKSIVNVLIRIWDKKDRDIAEGPTGKWTDYEYLILAMLDSRGIILHGTNCEYPIILDNEFWRWLVSIKDDEALEDN